MNAADRHIQDRTGWRTWTPLLSLVVATGLTLGGGPAAHAQTESIPPQSDYVPDSEPTPAPPEEAPDAGVETPGQPAGEPFHFVANVLDSVFSVEPAEFFGIDMPEDPPGARAVHLLGTISVVGKGDIQVRLFRESEYQNWLKKRGGRKAEPYWTSKKLRTINLDQKLTPGTKVVLLIDNGYSVRTPKRVRTTLQIQYERTGPGPTTAVSSSGSASVRDDFITPRSNTEEDIPPPPPPPPPDGAAE